MFSRRPDPRFNRGRIAVAAGSSAPAPPPSTTIGTIAAANGYPPQWNVRADYGYALGAGGGVSDLLDLTGNGWSFSEPVEGSQALWLPTDANGHPAIQGDGVDDKLTNSFNRGGPIVAGTPATHVWVVLVAKQNTWTINDTLYSDGGVTLYQNTTSGGMRIYAGTNGPQNNNLSGYKRIVMNFTGATSAYLWIGSSIVNGTNVGTTASGANNVLLAAPGGVRFFDGAFAEAAMGYGDISAGAITAIDAYCVARYGAGSTA